MQANQEPKKSVTDYLGSLSWDGTPRIDRWLIDCASAEAYLARKINPNKKR
jgi:hypothetical protein